jgi:3',5'-cyclic AMP phosphodiesterase CpdA
VTRILHLSDIHFGWPAVPEQADAVEAMAQHERFDVVAVSGDFAQRARAGEFQRAAVFLRDLRRPQSGQPIPALIVVPGNHDVAWWFAPLGIGQRRRLYEKYQRYIASDLEPVLQLPGVTFVGLNSAAGVDWHTLTWNPRDVSVQGGLRRSQIERAADILSRAPASDARVIVMHHNPLRGEISGRRGLVRSDEALQAFASMKVDLILCGHDHQEAAARVEHAGQGVVVSTAGTISSRARGGRPAAFNVITLTPQSIDVEMRAWSASEKCFQRTDTRCFAR